ncbi:hypothetical protein [Arthrobacter sp. E3]|uniref:hypothetical protein n=1 Tax=Arthrobacter sp. E3 TaxID=517402 RepID=UPI001A943EF7|nr:hypothetical protein [Arthrobacter sp. E3]
MLYALSATTHIPARTVGQPRTHALTRAGGLLAATALAAVLLLAPPYSQTPVPAGLSAAVSGTAQLVENTSVVAGPTFVVTKGQKG